MNATLRQKLKQARIRLVRNDFLQGSIRALLVGLVALVLTWIFFRPANIAFFATIFLALPLAALALRVFLRWRSSTEVARELDRRASTRDRFGTALTLAPGPWTTTVQDEITAYATNLKVGDFLRPKFPARRMLWLLAPLAVLVGWEAAWKFQHEGLRDERTQATALLEQVREAAEKSLEADPQDSTREDLEKALAAVPDSNDPLRDALRALAELERKLSSGSEGLTPAESSALADAVENDSPQLAAELRNGQDTTKSLSQLDPAALAQALEKAAQHLENRRLQEMTREELQQQIAAMQNSSSNPNRKKFLSALRDAKQGTSGESPESPPGESSMEGEGKDGEKPGQGLADNTPPGGAAGSEKDQGEGGDFDPSDPSADADDRAEEFVAGQLAEGASLVEILHSAGGDDPIARRAWQDTLNLAAPAALDAVQREHIPTGSRLLVKRYFETIRPSE